MVRIAEKKIQLIVLMLFWFVMLIICRPFDKSQGLIQSVQCFDSAEMCVLAEMNQSNEVEQNFIAEHEHLQSISFMPGTYERTNSGELKVTIAEAGSEKEVYSTTVDVSKVPNIDWVTVDVPENEIIKGKEYTIKFKADSPSETAIALMSGTSDKLPHASLNKIPVDNSVRMQFKYHDIGLFKVRMLVWFFVILVSVFLVIAVKKADENSFLLIAIVMGLILVFTNPFPHPLDERTHYFRSFMISEMNMIDDLSEEGRIGGYVSDNYGSVIDEEMNLESLANDNDAWMQKYSDNKEFYYNPYMSSYNPMNHLMGAIGIWIGNLFHLPAVCCIYLGRIITLASYIIMAYIAIREAEHYKSLFFCVSTLPMSLFLAASFSADPVLMGATIMFISICLKFRFNPEQQIRNWELCLLIVGVIFIASSKYLIYIPVLLLFFIIPRKCFKDDRTFWIEIAVAAVVVVVSAGIAVYLLKLFDYVEDRNGHVDVGEQLAFLLSHKVKGLGYLVDSFFETLFTNLVGIGFHAWTLESLSAVCSFDYVIYAAIILFAATEEKTYAFVKKKEKVMLCALFAAILFVVYSMTVGALYLGFTPVGDPLAQGVQPRYILPIMPMVLMLVSFIIPLKSDNEKASEIMPIFMIIACMNVLCGILTRTFV